MYSQYRAWHSLPNMVRFCNNYIAKDLPVTQTVKISIRPGTRLPSIGMDNASIAQNTVANVVLTVIVCSVL